MAPFEWKDDWEMTTKPWTIITKLQGNGGATSITTEGTSIATEENAIETTTKKKHFKKKHKNKFKVYINSFKT